MSSVIVGFIQKLHLLFLDRSVFLVIYPIILALGLLIRALLSQELFEQFKNSYWISDQNIINKVFANHGLEIFASLSVLILVVRVIVTELQNGKAPLLPTSFSSRGQTFEKIERYAKIAVLYGARYAITYGVLVVLFKLKNYESSSTGGACQPSLQAKSTDESLSTLSKRSLELTCLPGEEWIPGSLNISGHYFFIVTLSLSLFYELKILLHSSMDSIDRSFEEQDDGLGFSRKLMISIISITTITLLTCAVLLIWCGTLSVTAIFYHKIHEKIMGLLFGYVGPVVNYIILLRYYEA